MKVALDGCVALVTGAARGIGQAIADVFAGPAVSGPNPPGTTAAGYGELKGAKPLTVGWHDR